MPRTSYLSLDVGERRIGVALAQSDVKLAVPLTTIVVDGQELTVIASLVAQHSITRLVLGYPRNQAGEATQQTQYVEDFAARLGRVVDCPIVYQDESLTSVVAEERLRSRGRPYDKADIDAEAAAILLQDYLESR